MGTSADQAIFVAPGRRLDASAHQQITRALVVPPTTAADQTTILTFQALMTPPAQ